MTENFWNYPYNYSNGTEIEGVGNLLQYTNVISNGYIGMIVVFLMFLVSLLSMMAFGVKKALLASSFIAFIFSVYFLRLGMINPIVSFVLVFLMIVGALGSAKSSSY